MKDGALEISIRPGEALSASITFENGMPPENETMGLVRELVEAASNLNEASGGSGFYFTGITYTDRATGEIVSVIANGLFPWNREMKS